MKKNIFFLSFYSFYPFFNFICFDNNLIDLLDIKKADKLIELKFIYYKEILEKHFSINKKELFYHKYFCSDFILNHNEISKLTCKKINEILINCLENFKDYEYIIGIGNGFPTIFTIYIIYSFYKIFKYLPYIVLEDINSLLIPSFNKKIDSIRPKQHIKEFEFKFKFFEPEDLKNKEIAFIFDDNYNKIKSYCTTTEKIEIDFINHLYVLLRYIICKKKRNLVLQKITKYELNDLSFHWGYDRKYYEEKLREYPEEVRELIEDYFITSFSFTRIEELLAQKTINYCKRRLLKIFEQFLQNKKKKKYNTVFFFVPAFDQMWRIILYIYTFFEVTEILPPTIIFKEFTSFSEPIILKTEQL
jgi:hypothetical protein